MIQCSNLSVIGCTNSKLVRLRWFSCQVLYRRRYKFESRKVFQNSCQIFEQLLPENSSPRAFKIAQSDHTGWSTVVRPSASYTGELGFESTTYNYSYLYLFIGSCLWPKIGKWMARFENKIWSSVVKLSLSPSVSLKAVFVDKRKLLFCVTKSGNCFITFVEGKHTCYLLYIITSHNLVKMTQL